MTSETSTLDSGLDDLLNRHFPGKVVRKDLTKLVKEGANVPVYVLEYLLGTLLRLERRGHDRGWSPDGQKDPRRELRASRRGRKSEIVDPRARQSQGYRQGDRDAERKAGRL